MLQTLSSKWAETFCAVSLSLNIHTSHVFHGGWCCCLTLSFCCLWHNKPEITCNLPSSVSEDVKDERKKNIFFIIICPCSSIVYIWPLYIWNKATLNRKGVQSLQGRKKYVSLKWSVFSLLWENQYVWNVRIIFLNN